MIPPQFQKHANQQKNKELGLHSAHAKPSHYDSAAKDAKESPAKHAADIKAGIDRPDPAPKGKGLPSGFIPVRNPANTAEERKSQQAAVKKKMMLQQLKKGK